MTAANPKSERDQDWNGKAAHNHSPNIMPTLYCPACWEIYGPKFNPNPPDAKNPTDKGVVSSPNNRAEEPNYTPDPSQALEKLLYEYITSFQAVDYEALADAIKSWSTQLEQKAYIQALDDALLAVGEDGSYLINPKELRAEIRRKLKEKSN